METKFTKREMENIDKIKCLLIDFENNDKTLDEAAKEILLLFSDSKRCETLAIAALDKIAHPIKSLQKEAEKDGCKLNGCMAIQLTQNPNFYIEIAEKALKAIANCY